MWSLFGRRERESGERPAVPIERASHLLDTMLCSSEQHIVAVARVFEDLAAKVEGVLTITGEIVNCLEENCSASIVPMTRTLRAAASQFIAQRIASISAIAEVFANEAKMLESLSGFTRYQRSIAREVNLLGIITRIEVARSDMKGERFQHMATELHEFSSMVLLSAEDVQGQIDQRRTGLAHRRRRLEESLRRMTSQARSFEIHLGEATCSMDRAITELMGVPAQFRDCVAEVASKITRVVAAVQMQDMTRQQAEHARHELAALTSEALNERDGSHGRTAAVLRIQRMQLESASARTAEWMSEIESCLTNIQSIGSSELTGIGASILEHERGLSEQLRQIDDLTREAKLDDAEIEQSLAGLDELMKIVRAHLELSQAACERMHRLNLNAIIEATHLGDRAAAVLEIASQISRISADWSELTSRSSQSMEETLRASARTEDSTRAVATASRESLCEAQRHSRAGVATMQEAAEAAAVKAEQVQSAVSSLHGRIADLTALAHQLRESLQLIGQVVEQIEQAEARWGKYDPDVPAAFEREELEAACAAVYTSEVERQVLRAALYGETMPSAAADVVGNDVELF